MRLWDIDSGEERKKMEGHAATFLLDGKSAFADRRDGSMTLWNLDAGTEIATLNQRQVTALPSLAMVNPRFPEVSMEPSGFGAFQRLC